MRPGKLAALLFLPAFAGCKKAEKPRAAPATQRPHVLAGVPRLPGSAITDTTGSEDAERLTLVVQATYDSVLRFYRQQLPEAGWHVTSDVADTASASLLASRDSISLWVQVHRVGQLAAEYTLIAGTGTAEPRRR